MLPFFFSNCLLFAFSLIFSITILSFLKCYWYLSLYHNLGNFARSLCMPPDYCESIAPNKNASETLYVQQGSFFHTRYFEDTLPNRRRLGRIFYRSSCNTFSLYRLASWELCHSPCDIKYICESSISNYCVFFVVHSNASYC